MRRSFVTLILLACSIVLVFLWMGRFLLDYRKSLPNIKYPSNIIEESERYELYDMDYFEMEPIPGKNNIIFLETRCTIKPNIIKDSGLLLTKRQSCTIESAANRNPDASVHLLYSCSINGGLKASLPYVKVLFKYPNIKIWKLDIPQFLAGTPLKDWDFKAHLEKSKWPVEHSSDVLRFLSLWKYGGTYLDLDVITRRSLKVLGTNYLGKEGQDLLSACALNFAYEGVGRNASEMCVNEIFTNFWGESWNHNGPDLVTRVFKKICNVEKVEEMNPDRCHGLKVLPETNFTPLPYSQWGSLFTSTDVQQVMEKFNTSFGVHAWNSLSKANNINLLIMQPYGLLALNFCPRVHDHSDINF